MATKTTTAKRHLSDFLGILNEKEAELLEKTIKKNRGMHRKLHEKRIKYIQEEFKNLPKTNNENSAYHWEGGEVKKYTCPCCSYKTLDEPIGSFDICPICFWEADSVQSTNPETCCNTQENQRNLILRILNGNQ